MAVPSWSQDRNAFVPDRPCSGVCMQVGSVEKRRVSPVGAGGGGGGHSLGVSRASGILEETVPVWPQGEVMMGSVGEGCMGPTAESQRLPKITGFPSIPLMVPSRTGCPDLLCPPSPPASNQLTPENPGNMPIGVPVPGYWQLPPPSPIPPLETLVWLLFFDSVYQLTSIHKRNQFAGKIKVCYSLNFP